MDDRQKIRDVVEAWAVHRDAGDWDRFATVWHEDGHMTATWFQGGYREFIEASREGWEKGVQILHFLGGSVVDVEGDRAIAQTKMTISQRAEVHHELVDAVCTGRFYDFFERRDDRWAVVRRQPIYESDRLDALNPSVRLQLDASRLARFPAGYRHLAYVQTTIGFDVKDDLPGLRGAPVQLLYAEGAAWLRGAPGASARPL